MVVHREAEDNREDKDRQEGLHHPRRFDPGMPILENQDDDTVSGTGRKQVQDNGLERNDHRPEDQQQHHKAQTQNEEPDQWVVKIDNLIKLHSGLATDVNLDTRQLAEVGRDGFGPQLPDYIAVGIVVPRTGLQETQHYRFAVQRRGQFHRPAQARQLQGRLLEALDSLLGLGLVGLN